MRNISFNIHLFPDFFFFCKAIFHSSIKFCNGVPQESVFYAYCYINTLGQNVDDTKFNFNSDDTDSASTSKAGFKCF